MHRKFASWWLALLVALSIGLPIHRSDAADEQAPPQGQRVFYTGHSFHMFVVPRVEQLVKSANISTHKLAGRQSIGGSKVIQHWDLGKGKNEARSALESGQVDVFTMAAHLMIPDPGIEHFTELGLKHNPNLRLLVQHSWMPWDITAPDRKVTDNAQRDETDLAALQKSTDEWRQKIEAQVDELNKRFGKHLEIVPVGDAVNKLRGLVVAGKFPGVAKQSELFTDPIGHATGPVQALAAYCNYAVIYHRSPVVLKLNEPGLDDQQHAILQQIAWDTVSQYPYAGIAKQ